MKQWRGLDFFKVVICFFTGALLVGCEDGTESPKARFPTSLGQVNQSAGDPNRFHRGELVLANGAGDALRQPEFFDGAEWEARTGIVENGLQNFENDDTVSLNFVDTSIREVLEVILTRTLQRNYFLDQRVKGMVTARTSKPIPRESLMPMLENILALNGAVIVESGGTLNVVPLGAVPMLSKSVVVDPNSSPTRPGIGVYIIPLKHASVESVAEVVSRQVSAGSELAIDKARDMLIYTGPGTEARAIADMVEVLDIDGLKGMSFALLPVQSADANVVLEELQAMLSSNASGVSGSLVDLVVVERLNGILAVSKRPSDLRLVSKWVRELDRADARSGSRVYVYYARNSRAKDLAEVLQQVFASDVGNITVDKPRTLAPGLAEVEIKPEGVVETPLTVADAGRIIAKGDDDIRIVADERRNGIVIVATAKQYELIEATLKRIDILPLQVLIEATIAEVTLNDDLSYGLQWAFTAGNLSGSLVNGTGAAVSGSFPGFNLVYETSDARAVLSALSEVTNVSIVSSPQLTVLDNETARLQVGDSVPVSTQTSVSTGNPDAPIVNKIEYFDTGVILEVTPRVNANGLVTIEIMQEVSDAVPTITSGINSPTISQRRFESTVSIASGATVALGGLIRDAARSGESGLPGARKAGFLGNLFKTKRTGYDRTELLVLITPRVIRSPNEAHAITNELRQRLQNIAQIQN